MRRLSALLPTLALLVALSGCASVSRASAPSDDPAPAAPVQEGGGSGGSGRRAAGPGVGDYALVLPQNVVWLPWKALGGAGRGIVDGVAAGFAEERVPVVGLVFSPLNAAMGLVTGFGTGLVSEPGFIGPSTNFGRAMGLPMQRPTPIWWLP